MRWARNGVRAHCNRSVLWVHVMGGRLVVIRAHCNRCVLWAHVMGVAFATPSAVQAWRHCIRAQVIGTRCVIGCPLESVHCVDVVHLALASGHTQSAGVSCTRAYWSPCIDRRAFAYWVDVRALKERSAGPRVNEEGQYSCNNLHLMGGVEVWHWLNHQSR